MTGFAPFALAFVTTPLTLDEIAYGQCQYSVQEIVPPSCQFGGPPPLIARGLNNLGHVVGDFADCSISGVRHPFLWTEEDGMTVFAIPEWALRTHFMDINDHGVIAGHHILPDGIHGVGFVFDPDTDLYLEFEPKHGIGGSWANAINNSGIVAGSRTVAEKGDPWPWPQNAVIWDTNTGDVQDLGVMGGPHSIGRGINEDSVVVGWHGGINWSSANSQAFLWSDGEQIDLGTLPGSTHSAALDVNSQAQVAGVSRVGGAFRAFLWSNGNLVDLGTLDGASSAVAFSINDYGQVFGNSPSGGNQIRAFLWQHDHMHDLNDHVPLSNMSTAGSSNLLGQIIANANTVGVLLTPKVIEIADLNFDCRVDVDDLLILLGQWGPMDGAALIANGAPTADLNGDGVVNVSDLLILLGHWSP